MSVAQTTPVITTRNAFNQQKPGTLSLPLTHNWTARSGAESLHYPGFTITQRCTTVGSTPQDKWSARRRDLYLTTHSTHNRQTSMPSVGFEPAIPASERPQTHSLDRAITWSGNLELANVYRWSSSGKLHRDAVRHFLNPWRTRINLHHIQRFG
jgi:hypothetical protein